MAQHVHHYPIYCSPLALEPGAVLPDAEGRPWRLVRVDRAPSLASRPVTMSSFTLAPIGRVSSPSWRPRTEGGVGPFGMRAVIATARERLSDAEAEARALGIAGGCWT